MQYESPIRRSPFALTPWVKGLIVVNTVVYLLMITVFTGPWVINLTAFSPAEAGERWWTFLTYMFVHGGFLHLVFNMLMLFFFGPAVEQRMGSRAFGLFYFTCGAGGAIFSFAIALVSPVAPFVGASAAVLGVALAFAMAWPDAPIYVFPLPMPIKVKWLVAFIAVLSLFAASFGATDGVAHLAHLGGLLFGFIYLKGEDHVTRRAHQALRRHREQRELLRSARPLRPLATSSVTAERKAASDEGPENDEVDRVLDKISESGMQSLTPEERRLLDEASRRLRQHQH